MRSDRSAQRCSVGIQQIRHRVLPSESAGDALVADFAHPCALVRVVEQAIDITREFALVVRPDIDDRRAAGCTGLGQIEGDTVELHLADAGAPTLIRQNDKSPALYVLMPMRV